MAENGTATFASPDDYQAGIGGVSSKGASVNFIVTGGGDFKARLTWLNLHRLRVLRGSENLAEHCLCVDAAGAGGGAVSDQHGAIDMGRTRVAVRRYRFSRPRRTDASMDPRGRQMGSCFTAARSAFRLRTGPDRQENNRAAFPSGAAAAESRRVAPAATSRKSLPTRRNAARVDRQIRKSLRSLEQELLHALVNCLTADDIDGNLETLRHHAEIMVRFEEALGRACRPAVEHIRALPGDRRAGADVADVLRRISGHESQPVFSAAAAEQGARRVAACRSGACKRRRDCPELPIPRARAVRRYLSHRVRGNALGHAAARTDQNT